MAGIKGLPRGYGRPYKTDRGEVIGVAAALRRWFTINHEDRLAIEDAKRTAFKRGLTGVPGVTITIPTAAQLGPNVNVVIHIDESKSVLTGTELISQLEQGDPPIWTRTHDGEKTIAIGVQMLSDEDVETVITRIAGLLK